jgi:large subunit ribosomal protein L22
MIAKATARFIRVSPKKVRLVADLVRGKSYIDAADILASVNKQAKVYVNEVVKSAVSNAKRKDDKLNEESLFISRINVDGGPFLTRYRAASMGRASIIRHRTSHICVELDILKDKQAGKPSGKGAEKPKTKIAAAKDKIKRKMKASSKTTAKKEVKKGGK